jgi:hypothetical protein
MIANFDSETHNVQVFLETGDLAVLETEPVEGNILTVNNPGKAPGTAEINYSEGDQRRPEITREHIQDEKSVDNFSLEIFEPQYQHLQDNGVYHDRVGAFQDLAGEAKIWIFPPENQGEYGYMLDDLNFYENLTEEQREKYREKL